MTDTTERGVRVPHLRAWRRDRGQTQSELADAAGVAASTVTRAEMGRSIHMTNARKLAAALEITYRQLLYDEPIHPKAEPAA